MRITSNQYHSIMAQVNRQATAGLMDTQIRMATEKRILRPSDDPTGAVRLAMLVQADAMLDQYRATGAMLNSRLQHSERVMSGIVDQLQNEAVKHLGFAMDGSRSPEDLSAYAQVLASVRDTLLQSANTRDSSGNYLFSGTAITTAPIRFDPAAPVGSRYTFEGNLEKQTAVVGDGVTEVANESLAEMADGLNALDEAIAKMSEPNANPNDPAYRDVLGRATDTIESVLASVNAKIGRMGSTQARLQMLDELHESAQIVGNQAALDVGKISPEEVFTDYQSYMVALQASQKLYAEVTQLTLLNVL
ncbi:flagellar hook-associated protein FlgL [Burkholderia pseudomallei]|uniref:flagellin N-terminal helical domain-containing protein n=1 Tax=Burkholderia pseudomallei TaxID=28450 RepID=UPI00016AC53B|nr:flagellar hook-associated protein FlgL [Burkholderia pseudomallei]AHE30380.1 flagellar hook-associated protein 3 [Burkholderia pseudomallei NCTC 13178]AHE36620.1 flagellar hook-associated protein 3 [Burkholderia pseudomallei NAU20B-16]AHG37712.1 flagellar hook-associated protein 3 [Burkholderia pseudomallei MSHR511]AHG69830.1 flagellar hook-associated protein 3 [Burkholderia pseudomallei MSHR146]AIV58010.1 flagellar hook-associated protein 3 [Burkholderia pseudomallei MSHR2243]